MQNYNLAYINQILNIKMILLTINYISVILFPEICFTIQNEYNINIMHYKYIISISVTYCIYICVILYYVVICMYILLLLHLIWKTCSINYAFKIQIAK